MTESHSTRIKDIMYEYFGFQFNNEGDILSYKDVFDSIALGPAFGHICKNLGLDPDVLSPLIKKHVLHLTCEDVIASVTYDDKVLYDQHSHLWVDEQDDPGDEEESIVAIVDEYFNGPRDFVEYYDDFLGGINTELDGRFDDERCAQLIKPLFPELSHLSEVPSSIWHRKLRVSGSLYRTVLKRQIAAGEMTLTRQTGRIRNKRQERDDSTDFFHNAVKKTRWFLGNIETWTEELPTYSPTQDLVEFESDTNMLFLFQATSLFIFTSRYTTNEHRYSSDEMKVLSSFILIDDPDIRSYFNETFYVESGLYVRLMHWDGYYYFFLLIFCLIPFLVKYVKNELSLLMCSDTINEINKLDLEPGLKNRLIRLYEKDFIYKLVKNPEAIRVSTHVNTLIYIEQHEHLHRIQDHFSKLHNAVGLMKKRINQKVKDRQDFRSRFLLEASFRYRAYKNENDADFQDEVADLISDTANYFTRLVGLRSQKDKKKPSFERLVESIDSFYSGLEDEEEVKHIHGRLLSELKQRGWSI